VVTINRFRSNRRDDARPLLSLVAVVAMLAWSTEVLALENSSARRRAVEASPLPVDCPGIQRAIDSLPSGGGQVQLLAQTYTCGGAIVIARDNVVLRGAGPATVLRLADGASSPVLVIGASEPAPAVTHRNIGVYDLSIDGNRLNQAFECLGGPCSASNPLRNNGITIRRVEDATVANVAVRSARSGGLVTELGVRRVTVTGFTASDSFFDGLAGYETEDSVFDRLYLHDNGAAGFSFDIGFNHNLVSNTVIESAAKVGIFMRDSRNNIFHGVLIRNSKEHGVFLAQVDTDTTKPASGNSFIALVVASSAGAGFRANDASCINNSVVGAQLIANAGGGISEATPGLVQTIGVVTR
jgi:hypothetical protein